VTKVGVLGEIALSSDPLTYTDTTSTPSQISPEPWLHIGQKAGISSTQKCVDAMSGYSYSYAQTHVQFGYWMLLRALQLPPTTATTWDYMAAVVTCHCM